MLVTKETLYSTLDDTWDKVRSNGTTDYQGALLDAQSFIETLKQFQAQVKDADKKIAKSLKNDFDFLENEADELVRLLQGAIWSNQKANPSLICWRIGNSGSPHIFRVEVDIWYDGSVTKLGVGISHLVFPFIPNKNSFTLFYRIYPSRTFGLDLDDLLEI